jgi:hypothetical protein
VTTGSDKSQELHIGPSRITPLPGHAQAESFVNLGFDRLLDTLSRSSLGLQRDDDVLGGKVPKSGLPMTFTLVRVSRLQPPGGHLRIHP